MFSELLENTFLITISFLFLSAIISIFIRSKKQDKCLKDFSNYQVSLFLSSQEEPIKGKAKVEGSGIELFYKSVKDELPIKTSYILYKNEFSSIEALVRYPEELSEKRLKKRARDLEKTYHPTVSRRVLRKIKNFFNQARDTCVEIINLFIGKAQKAAPGGGVLSSQEKSLGSVKSDLMGFSETAFDPILERYIGRKIVFSLGKKEEYSGILKEYSSNFIEIIDATIPDGNSLKPPTKSVEEFSPLQAQGGRKPPRRAAVGAGAKADLVLPRSKAIVRHFGERIR